MSIVRRSDAPIETRSIEESKPAMSQKPASQLLVVKVYSPASCQEELASVSCSQSLRLERLERSSDALRPSN